MIFEGIVEILQLRHRASECVCTYALCIVNTCGLAGAYLRLPGAFHNRSTNDFHRNFLLCRNLAYKVLPCPEVDTGIVGLVRSTVS